MNYRSPFKRINITNEGAKAIGLIQNEYENLWNKLRKLAPNVPEKFKALQSLQESCMFMSRATSVNHEKVDMQSKPKPTKRAMEIEDQPIPAAAQKEEGFKNSPRS